MFAMVVCQIVNCFAFWFQSCYSLHCVASFLLFGGQLRSFCSYIEYAIHVLSIISVVSLHSWYFSRTDQTNRRVVLYCMIVCVMFVCVCVCARRIITHPQLYLEKGVGLNIARDQWCWGNWKIGKHFETMSTLSTLWTFKFRIQLQHQHRSHHWSVDC